MSKISVDMLTDIEKDTVDFMANYDDRLKEPVVLPSRFPNILVNGSTGIAVGMATNIPPHNMGEVIDAIDLLIDDPDAGLDQIMECIKGPDFPTGGIIMGRERHPRGLCDRARADHPACACRDPGDEEWPLPHCGDRDSVYGQQGAAD